MSGPQKFPQLKSFEIKTLQRETIFLTILIVFLGFFLSVMVIFVDFELILMFIIYRILIELF